MTYLSSSVFLQRRKIKSKKGVITKAFSCLVVELRLGSLNFYQCCFFTAGQSHCCSFPQCLPLPFSACSVVPHILNTDWHQVTTQYLFSSLKVHLDVQLMFPMCFWNHNPQGQQGGCRDEVSLEMLQIPFIPSAL